MAVLSPAAGPLAPPVAAAAPRPRAATALLVALIAAAVYAAFADGAVGLPRESRLQVGIALIAALAAAAWLWDGGLRLRAAPAAWVGIALLAGFAVWTAVSLAWSVAPDRTWEELNRLVAYLLVALLAIAFGASHPRPARALAHGYLAVAVAIALYALGGKLVPGLRIPGIVDLNQTQDVARLRAPLQYWNALALACALAAPIALSVAIDRARAEAWRLAGLVAATLLLATMALTYSRGGFIALVAGLVATLALAGAVRLRLLTAAALAAAAAVAPVLFTFARHDLTANGLALGAREDDGALLSLVLLAALAALVLAGRRLIALEPRVTWSAARSRRAGRALAAAAAVALVAALGAVALSHRGLAGTASHAWDRFTSVREDRQGDPARLVSSNGGNRWVWWKEAAGAWSDRPVTGWGAGSFPVEHKRYRRDTLEVLQPHSLPLQLLAETGLVGAVLALGGLALLLAAGVAGVRRRPAGPERALAAALAGSAVAWLVHCLYDWDWDIPGVTLPLLLFLGVLAARAPGARRLGAEAGAGRAAALAGVVALMALAAVSAVLPAWAQSKADGALASLGPTASDAQLDHADHQARLAARLDPLALDGLFARATIAERRRRLDDARAALLDAVRRQPDSELAWSKLASLDLIRVDVAGARRAAARALALDPMNPVARDIAARAAAVLTPSADSPTATGTPLPAGG
jgi:hypothetical protein